jgi:large subunit ribosomal protein L14
MGTILKVTDKTGVSLVQCIKVFGHSRKRIAKLGDVVLVSVKWISRRRYANLKVRLKKRFGLGTMHRALLVRSRVNFMRTGGIFLRFDENSVVLVNKRVVPVSNRVYGPILKEFCMLWPSLGCVTRSLL